jgi:putative transposase
MKIAPYATCVNDFQWKLVQRFLPRPAKTGRPPANLRRVLDAILYLVKTGCQWRMLPSDFPRWRTVYGHFQAWNQSGRLKKIHESLRSALRELAGRVPQASAGIIDSQTVRSDAHGGNVGYDAGKKTKGRKRFLCVDTLGYIVTVLIASADLPERAGARVLLEPILRSGNVAKIWADGGFSGPDLAAWAWATGNGTDLEIVRRGENASGFRVLPKRWVVERTFAWLVQNRRLVRDYEKSFQSAEAFVYLAAIRLMLNQYC